MGYCSSGSIARLCGLLPVYRHADASGNRPPAQPFVAPLTVSSCDQFLWRFFHGKPIAGLLLLTPLFARPMPRHVEGRWWSGGPSFSKVPQPLRRLHGITIRRVQSLFHVRRTKLTDSGSVIFGPKDRDTGQYYAGRRTTDSPRIYGQE